MLAAHRAGSKYIIAPFANKPDWAELPRVVRRELEFIWVETMDQVVEWVLRPATGDEPAIVVEPTGTAVAAVTDESETTVISDNGSIHEFALSADRVSAWAQALAAPE